MQEQIINLVIYIHIWTLLYVYYLDEEDEPMKTVQAPAEESDDDDDDDDSGKNLFVLAWFQLLFLPTWPKELFHCHTLNLSSQSSIDLDVPMMVLYNLNPSLTTDFNGCQKKPQTLEGDYLLGKV